MNREYCSDAENVKMVERETLATRVSRLESALEDLWNQHRKALEDLESHHIRLIRTEKETGLLQ